jgi:hypothetical protein
MPTKIFAQQKRSIRRNARAKSKNALWRLSL